MNLRRSVMLASFGVALALSPPRADRAWAQYDSVLQSPGAAEQLRLGVQSYHRGHYAESVLLFEKALAYAPGTALIEYWLGRAYLKSGYEETALRVWAAPPRRAGPAALPEGQGGLPARFEGHPFRYGNL